MVFNNRVVKQPTIGDTHLCSLLVPTFLTLVDGAKQAKSVVL